MELRVIGLISFLSLVNAFDYQHRCLLYNKECVTYCPRYMHPYHTRCDAETLSQRTCDSPRIYEMGYTCGWSRCDCNGDLVLDEDTGYCVALDACTSTNFKSKRKGKGKLRRTRKPYGLRKKKVLENMDDNPLEM